MCFSIGWKIVSRHAETCSSDMSLLHAGHFPRRLKRLFDHIEETIVPNTLMIPAARPAKANALTRFIHE